jgi:RNA polymerase sigma-70 factor (ECF subfamily)
VENQELADTSHWQATRERHIITIAENDILPFCADTPSGWSFTFAVRAIVRGRSMAETSVSLLERLRRQPDSPDWQRLVAIYTPLVHGWLRRQEVPPTDADDLVQEVLAVVVRELPAFEHNQRPGAFRAWLRGITVNRIRGYWRTRQRPDRASGESEAARQLDQLEDPDSGLSQIWDQEHDRHVMARLLEIVEKEVTPSTWQAFRAVVLEGKAETAVADELGLSVNAVFIAKSRVLSRLRREAQGLID